ncbi:MAG: hypothetical protein AAGE52_22595 [Myxococcota bacterium]
MDCEHRDRLIDLVYGEMEPAEADALRRLVMECAQCREELRELEETKRLADTLPLEPMPLTAHNLIMAAASEAAAKKKVAPPRKSWWAALSGWFQGSAAPQIAMAAVMLVVVAVGVSYSPEEEADELTTEMLPDPAIETVSTEQEPEEESEEESAPEREPVADRSAEGESIDELREDPVRGPPAERTVAREVRSTRRSALERSNNEALGAQRFSTSNTQRAGEVADLDLADAPNSVVVDQPPIQAQAPRRPQARRPVVEGALEAFAPEAADEAVEAASVPMDVPIRQEEQAEREVNSIEPLRGDRQTFDRAMTRYRERDYRGAAEEFERVVRSPERDVRRLLPNAIHHLARSHKARGACRTALTHYETLIDQHRAYQDLPQALLEMADCYRRVGNLNRAETILIRAEGYGSTRERAQRERRRIQTLQRAQRRAAPTPSSSDSLEAY